MNSVRDQPGGAFAIHTGSLSLTIAAFALVGGCVTQKDPSATPTSTDGSDDASGSGTSTVETETGSSDYLDPDCYPHTTPEACAAAGAPCGFWDASEIALVDGECVQTAEYGDVGWCVGGAYGGSDVGTLQYEIATGRVFAIGFYPAMPIPGWAPCKCAEGEPPACSCVATCFPFPPSGTTGSTGASEATTADTNGVTTSSG